MIFVGKYDQGMKMLVKLSKNPNATLHSDIEERGKGKRMKKPIKHFDNSDKENNPQKEQNVQLMLPPLPQLRNASKSNLPLSNQPLRDKVGTMTKESFIDKVLSSNNNVQQPIFVAHENNVSRKILKNKDTVYKGINLVKESSCFMEMHKSKSAANTSEEIYSSQEVSLNAAGCKICSKNQQECAYTSKGEVTLESLANAICNLNGKLKILSYMY